MIYFHRDLKPDNIIVNKITKNDKTYYKCKLCDYRQSKDARKSIFSSLVGTEGYMPKEVSNNKYTIKSDIFVLGLILYELYYGNKVSNFSEDEKLNNIKKGLTMKNEKDNKKEFEKLKDLIEKCIKDEKERIEWEDYFNHPFFDYEIEIKINIKEEDLNKNISLIGKDFNFKENKIENISLIGKDFNFKENTIELYIDGENETYEKEKKFDKKGIHVIIFKFNKNILSESLESMFKECNNIENINFKVFNTSNIINMSYMFSNCINLKKIEFNLFLFNTSKVENMNSMFNECKNLNEIDLSLFNISKVKNMNKMFYNCENIKDIDFLSFDFSNVKDIKSMFDGCENLKNFKLYNFNIIIELEINNPGNKNEINILYDKKQLNEDYFNKDNTKLYLNDKKIEFNYKLKFNNLGTYKIKIKSNVHLFSLSTMFYNCKTLLKSNL